MRFFVVIIISKQVFINKVSMVKKGAILLCAFAILMYSCKKENTPASEQKNEGFSQKVLVEKFTTTSCGNCGRADLDIEAFKKQYNGNVISVHYHLPTGQFGGDSMATMDGQNIASMFGLLGTPFAAINRNHLPGDTTKLLYAGGNWGSPIATGVALQAPCGISIDASTINNGVMDVKVGVKFTQTITEPLLLTVLLLEDSVTGDEGYWQANYYNADATVPQLFGRGHPIKDYVHNDVYRAAISPFWGQVIPTGNTLENTVYSTTLSIDISHYRTPHLKVVAFVHGQGEPLRLHKYKVLNAQETHAGSTQPF